MHAIQFALHALSQENIKALQKQLSEFADVCPANQILFDLCGIQTFFHHQEELDLFQEYLQMSPVSQYFDEVRREYGDFQTPSALTDAICRHVHQQGFRPQVMVEPTFGAGAFVFSALRHFPSLQTIYGVEIYAPYYWEMKGKILEWALRHPDRPRPNIVLACHDVFEYDFNSIASKVRDRDVLVLGNPPWVTNTELSKMRSDNVPKKRNVKQFRGLDAMTGKSNFDISETIVHVMLDAFAGCSGRIALLVKQAVVKHVLHDLPTRPYALKHLSASRIDAKKHFNASVDASLFEAVFQAQTPERTCQVSIFKEPSVRGRIFGWVGECFVANAHLYRQVAVYDRRSPYEWRQGLKHDCAKVMEFQISSTGTLVNGLGETVDLEPEVVYGLLKGSDLKQPVASIPRKYVLVTQRFLGEDTDYLSEQHPKTFAYLCRHRQRFEQRKSKIYRGKPPFSIFGIGEYAFSPYKVAISGLYKRANFSLILPEGGQPVMLDDTCYFLGFETLSEALMAWALLSNDTIRTLLQSIVFTGDKRPYTKQRLMRIGLDVLAAQTSYADISAHIQSLDERFAGQISETQWEEFIDKMDRA